MISNKNIIILVISIFLPNQLNSASSVNWKKPLTELYTAYNTKLVWIPRCDHYSMPISDFGKSALVMFSIPGIIRRVFYSCTLCNVICFCLCYAENASLHLVLCTLYVRSERNVPVIINKWKEFLNT